MKILATALELTAKTALFMMITAENIRHLVPNKRPDRAEQAANKPRT